MSKTSGRGRGWRRKGKWSLLSPSTQKRYLSSGITKELYEKGIGRSTFDKYVNDQAKYYDRDPAEVRELLSEVTKTDALKAIKDQQDMQALYDAGRLEEARAIWENRDRSLPDWMFYYHGLFS